MSNPRPGDYGVVRTSGLMGRLIRIGTLSRWNHAVIFTGNGTIIEATPQGVVESPADEYEVIPFNGSDALTAEQRLGIVRAARGMIGTPYNWLDIVALSLVSTVGFKPAWLIRRVARTDRLVCSQVVSQAYADAGVPLYKSPAYLVTPAMLANRLVEQFVRRRS